jgi:hypothetical protein
MTDEELEIFREITKFSGKPSDLHPLKLDKWWKTIVGAPDPIYLQMGFHTVFEQIDTGARAVQTMLDLVGHAALPVSHQEIAQRHIGHFAFHVAGGDSGTRLFTLNWDKAKNHWVLSPGEFDMTKMVPDLQAAVEKAVEWMPELDLASAAKE